MASLTDFIPQGGGADPFQQPAFYIPQSQSDVPGAGLLIYNHYLEIIGKAETGNDSYRRDYWNSSYGTEFSDNWGWSSSNPGSGNAYYIQGTAQNNYVGHKYWNVSTSPYGLGKVDVSHRGPGSFSPWQYLGNVVSDDNHAVLVLIGENGIAISPRSARIASYYYEQANSTYQNKMRTGAPSGLFSSGHTWVRGGLSYNAKTKVLVVMERSNYDHRPIVITGVDHPKDYLDRADAWGTHIAARISAGARYVGPYQDKPTNGSTEDQVRGVPVICDDGTIYYMQMITNWGSTCARFFFNGSTVTALTADGSNEGGARWWSRSWTTSYGVGDNGTYGGGIQWNMSNDGTKVWLYHNAYYYHCGFYGTFIDVSTGRAVGDYYRHDSSFGQGLVPIQKDLWLFGTGDNADSGTGMRTHLLEFESEWAYAGRNGANAKARKTSTDPSWNPRTQWINTPHHSTSYTMICQAEYDRASVGKAKI